MSNSMRWITGSRIRFTLLVFFMECCISAAAVLLPKNHAEILLMPFLLPDWIVSFIAGGGMCVVDGCASEWKLSIGMAAGFTLNAVLLGIVLYWSGRAYKLLRPVFRMQDLGLKETERR